MDHILYWNDVALEALRRDFTEVVPGESKPRPEQGGPTLSSRALAIVHLAMYDAHAAVINTPATLPPYEPGLVAPAGASVAAAVAGAARSTLLALYTRQKAFLDQRLAAAGLSGPGVDTGMMFGESVAQVHLSHRGADPGAGSAGYVPSKAPGHHRVDPMNPGQGFHAPFYGAGSKCFAVSARHGLANPPALGTADYLRYERQVRGKGCAPDLAGMLPAGFAKRTVDETLVGIYWAFDGPRELGTPPRLYNLIVREVAMAQGNTADQNARLFALVNAALGDAGILAWDQKYRHDVWRPVLGIREHDASMGPQGPTPTDNISDDCDPQWLPLGAPSSNSSEPNGTPPFPAYPSGHATFGAAAFQIVRRFYGVPANNHAIDALAPAFFVSQECNGTTQDNRGVVRARHERHFPGGLWQMILENGFSRVWLGVHWAYDAFALDAAGHPDLSQDVGGVPLGLKIAEDIFAAGGGKAPKKSTVGPRP